MFVFWGFLIGVWFWIFWFVFCSFGFRSELVGVGWLVGEGNKKFWCVRVGGEVRGVG